MEAGGISVEVELIPTQPAGHAGQIAYELAKAGGVPLIVSASGDGGYNEVANGVLQAKSDGGVAVCVVLASGNANDHSRTVLSMMHGKTQPNTTLSRSRTFSSNTTEK